VITKTALAAPASRPFVAAITSALSTAQVIALGLSAAPAGVKDGRLCSARRNFQEQFRRWREEEQSQSARGQNQH